MAAYGTTDDFCIGGGTGQSLQEAQDLDIVGPQVDLLVDDLVTEALRDAKDVKAGQGLCGRLNVTAADGCSNSVTSSHTDQQLTDDVANKCPLELALVRYALQHSIL